MADNSFATEALREKVAAILAKSALEPGINEMTELMKATAEARLVEQSYNDMLPPPFVTQTAHLYI